MPRARTARTQQVIVLPADEDEDAAEKLTKGLPLFPDSQGIQGISIYRLEPVEEGSLGSLPADADEESIRRRFGGGIFKITAKDSAGLYAGSRTVTIGGDPRFESLDARRRYRNKMAGLDDDSATRPAPVPVPAPPTVGATELITLLNTGHHQQVEMMRLQLEAQRQDNLAREERQRRENEDARARDREFQATILQVMRRDEKAGGGGLELVSMLLQGLKLGRTLGEKEEGSDDPVALFMKNLPAILEHGKGLIGQQPAPPPAPPAAPGVAPAATQERGFRLSGEVARRLQAEVERLMAKGYKPSDALKVAEAALARGVEILSATEIPPPPPEPQPAPPAPAPAPVSEPPSAPTPAPVPIEPPRPTSAKRASGGQAPAPRATPGR
jgi:hypothetical protein